MKFLKSAAIALCIFILACNRASDSQEKAMELAKDISSPKENKKEEDQNKFFAPQANANTDTSFKAPQQNPQSPKQNPDSKPDWDKKIIKNAFVNLEVKNYKSFNELIHDSIKQQGGYIAQEEQNQTDYKIENTVTIKVPVDQFDNLIASLTAGDQKILEKKITSEDVTTQIVDTKSRMEAKKQVRLRYLDLLKQARNMEEILNVQNEINGIQEDIEAATGRIEYLTHAAVYSTINLTYFQILNASAKDVNEPTFGTKIWQSFKNGWVWVGDVFIGLISIWPLFAIGFGCWLAYKKWRSSKIQKPAA
jgi:hypothetical protein